MTQQIIVYILVGVAFLYLLLRIRRRFSSLGSNCDCGSCPEDCPLRKKEYDKKEHLVGDKERHSQH